jgi:hypothetical protein
MDDGRSMRAVKGSLGCSLKKGIESSKTLARLTHSP